MIVRLILFAAAKDLMGSDCIDLTLDDGATVGELKQTIVEQHPSMLDLVENSTISVDQEYARDEQPLYHGAEIGLIPPVSGG